MTNNAIPAPFGSLYAVGDKRDRRIFGDNYCAEGEFVHGQWKLIARYSKPEGSDGQDVEVYEQRWPARFFRVVALPSENSVGRPIPGFALTTGSGDDMGVWAHRTALLVRDGMVGFDREGAAS